MFSPVTILFFIQQCHEPHIYLTVVALLLAATFTTVKKRRAKSSFCGDFGLFRGGRGCTLCEERSADVNGVPVLSVSASCGVDKMKELMDPETHRLIRRNKAP